MGYMVEFNFENGLAMNIKMFRSAKRTEVDKWLTDNGIEDGKVLEMHTVTVKE